MKKNEVTMMVRTLLRHMEQMDCHNTEGDYHEVFEHADGVMEFREYEYTKKDVFTVVNLAWNVYFYDNHNTVVAKEPNTNVLAEVQSAFNRGPVNAKEVNNFAHDCHRTIQQNLMRFIRDYLVTVATDWTLSFDARNEASRDFAKSLYSVEEVKEILNKTTFPFI